ncbi:MAG: hypothetical protein QM538_06420 [Methylacidiphilales bacterium]|nr:hypothetical protein [Candidatus Methylacidiphilales bacterium]
MKYYLEIKVIGKENGAEITPETTDITDLKEILDVATKLFNNSKLRISYIPKKGSACHQFHVQDKSAIEKTDLTIAKILSCNSVNNSYDSILKLQKKAKDKLLRYEISTSLQSDKPLIISQDTNYILEDKEWVDADLYLYGEINILGGLEKHKINIKTDTYGNVEVNAKKEEIDGISKHLYKTTIGLGVHCKLSLTDEIKDATLFEIIEYDPKYDEQEFIESVKKSTPHWADVPDAVEWVKKLRSG